MAYTEAQGLQVVRWGSHKIEYGTEPEAAAWVVDNSKNHTGLVWTTDDKIKEFEEKYGTATLQRGFAHSNASFKMGRPLREMSITIHPCLGPTRPNRLFRVVHADTPFKGVCARGYPYKFEPMLFQIRYQKHMNWNWRGASPFMSATTSYRKAISMCTHYEKRGHKNIKMLLVDTSGSWDSRRLIWNTATLASALDVKVAHCHPDEYLIMHSIPLHRVKVLKWDDLNNDAFRFGTIEEPKEGWLQYEYERQKAVVRHVGGALEQEELAGTPKTESMKQARTGSKRKRDNGGGGGVDDDGDAPRREKMKARGFAPLREEDMRRADAS